MKLLLSSFMLWIFHRSTAKQSAWPLTFSSSLLPADRWPQPNKTLGIIADAPAGRVEGLRPGAGRPEPVLRRTGPGPDPPPPPPSPLPPPQRQGQRQEAEVSGQNVLSAAVRHRRWADRQKTRRRKKIKHQNVHLYRTVLVQFLLQISQFTWNRTKITYK